MKNSNIDAARRLTRRITWGAGRKLLAALSRVGLLAAYRLLATSWAVATLPHFLVISRRVKAGRQNPAKDRPNWVVQDFAQRRPGEGSWASLRAVCEACRVEFDRRNPPEQGAPEERD